MRQQRWFRITALAVALFAINAVTRLVVRFGFDSSDAAQSRGSIVMFALVALVLGVLVFIWCQRRKPADWLPDAGFGALGGMLLTVLIGPFLSGSEPFANGGGDFFAQVWLYSGCAIVGALIGYWSAVLLGRDYRSRALQAFSHRRTVKPRKIVRR
jgi:membrane protein DedA with SNARE-associated domain